MSQWYYQLTGEVIGPVSFEELKQKAHDGEIDHDTLVREGADGQWVTAASIHGLLDLPVAPIEDPESEEDTELVSTEPDSEHVSEAVDRPEQGPRKSPLSLRPCLDCGKMVSKQATVCPNCGRLFHESRLVVRHKGEHPVPVLVVFSVLAIAFLLFSPTAVYFAVMNFASRTVEGEAASSGFALAVTGFYILLMIVCALLGGAVGKPRMAYITGLFLGLFFGPLGIFAAFAIDKRPQCCHCSSRLNGLARECPYCHGRLIWKVETTWYY